MASPFTIFRKNQKAMYALLAILCMVGFSIGGAIDYSDRMRSTADPVVATAYGKSIHASEVQQLLRRRRLAVSFLAECKAAEFNLPGVAQFFIPQFESTFGPATEEAVVETWVLDERAREMGLIVNDDAVNKFLKELTQDKVKPQVFGEIARRLDIGQPQLFDALRAELMALRLQTMAIGRLQTTPAQRWDYYRRQKQQATVEVAAVPVENFIGEIPDATDEDLQAFFDAHQDQEPDPESPTPGFKVPKKADFQVVIAKFNDFYDEKAVTEEEIQKHYEDFKDTRYLWEQYYLEGDEDASEPPSEAQPPSEAAPPAAGKDKPDGTETPKGEAPAEKDAAEKPSEKPDGAFLPLREGEGRGEGASKTNVVSVPHGQANSNATRPHPSPLPEGEGTQGAKADEKSPSSLPLHDALRGLAVRPAAIVTGLLFADDEDDSQDAKDAADAKSNDDKGKAAAKPATEQKKAAADKPADKKAKSAKTPATAPQITDELILNRDITKWPHPKHAPLWKVEDVIRKELAREKANQRIDEAVNVVREKMRKYARRMASDETEQKMPDLDPLAKTQKMTAVETGSLTARELREKFPDLAEAKGDPGSPAFVQIAYATMAKFQSTTVQDIETNRYLVWKVEEKDAFVPDFVDVRSKVLRVWKLVKARDLAAKKAQELAAEANQAGKSLKELFAGREDLSVQQPTPFSWLTRGSANVDNRSPLAVSEVQGVESAGPDFMREVFSLSVGSSGEAMNQPQTIAYVVRLVGLEPSPERLRNTFLADPFPLYNEAARDDFVQVQRAWMKGLEAEARLVWKEKVTARDE